jgi:hypothetical protein
MERCLPGGTGCYSATLPGPLVRNGDPGCYIGCYKLLRRVLHFPELQGNPVLRLSVDYSTENSEEWILVFKFEEPTRIGALF